MNKSVSPERHGLRRPQLWGRRLSAGEHNSRETTIFQSFKKLILIPAGVGHKR